MGVEWAKQHKFSDTLFQSGEGQSLLIRPQNHPQQPQFLSILRNPKEVAPNGQDRAGTE